MATHKFHATNNRKWYAVKQPPGKKGSERLVLYGFIFHRPGITSAELAERWGFMTSMRSRLKELQDKGFVRSELVSDLFTTQGATQ